MFRICLKIDKASRTAFPISKGRFHKGFEKKKSIESHMIKIFRLIQMRKSFNSCELAPKFKKWTLKIVRLCVLLTQLPT